MMSGVVESILREYPYPIAKCYERLVGSLDPAERWNRARYLMEATLQYAACVAVARYLHNGDYDEKTSAAMTCLHRPSLGHWLNLLIRCSAHNQVRKAAFIPADTFATVPGRPAMAKAYHAFRLGLDDGAGPPPSKMSVTRFLEGYIAYRNRTAGHGAPSGEHIAGMAPLLEEAAVELLENFSFLREHQLLYVPGIRLERKSCIHSVMRLTGTTQITMPDHVTTVADALVGRDRQLFLSEAGKDTPFVSLHPLAIYSRSEVFLLNHSDLQRNVDYICHHNGEYYSADRIFEDFQDTIGRFLKTNDINVSCFQPLDVYREAVRMSLIDGIITDEERQYLNEIKDQLDLSADCTESIEQTVRAEFSDQMPAQQQAALAPLPPTPRASSPADSEAGKGSAAIGRRLLFFSYASTGNTFWADFIGRLSSAAFERDWAFSLVTPDPGHAYDAEAMAGLVAELDRIIGMHRPDAMLVVPLPTAMFSAAFERRIRSYDIPVVVIDTAFSHGEVFAENGGYVPPSVTVDNAAGGRLAAQALLESMSEDATSARLLVMPGMDEAPHSQARVDGFKEEVQSRCPGMKVRQLPEGRFERSRAHDVFANFLEDVDLERYAGIFCCNDDMALGVYLAVCEYLQTTQTLVPFSIVGFNNTVEFRTVKAVDPHGILVASVDQTVEAYTRAAFATLDRLMQGETVPEDTLIAPTLSL